jgi:hypothetical protein
MSECLFPYSRWDSEVPALAEAYSRREPFPHAHLPRFLDSSTIAGMIDEFSSSTDEGWVQYKHYNENKRGLTNRAQFPPLIGRVVDELNSPAFVAWLSRLTGIPDLLPDPSLEGGGLHESAAGGFLNVHADFTRHHHQKNWRRRVNVIIYLNPDWRPEWGGAIELWDHAMTRCVVAVPPMANDAVIFNTDELAYHGFPDPITCPPGTTRKSLALYYYTLEEAGAVARSTNYQARPGDSAWTSALIWADKQAVHLYSRVKSTLGLSDDFASRALAFLDRRRSGKS